ncbi:aminopeptidase, partial [Pseudomonadota bacterium]
MLVSRARYPREFVDQPCLFVVYWRRLICLTRYLIIASLLGACSTVDYYYQSAKGQLEVISKSETIESLLEDENISAQLKEKLKRVIEIREYASSDLFLPENDSYTEYANLNRPYVLWNVFAAPELSIEAKSWCFPVAGCVNYRGYFDKQKAETFAKELAEQDYDVFLGGVPAYSTLGWFSDPLLSTVIHYKDPDLAALVFHELAHQLLYVKDDTVFNESFATTVELEGVRRWLQKNNNSDAINDVELVARQRDRAVALMLGYRDELGRIYGSENSKEWKRSQKVKTLDRLKINYHNLRQGSKLRFSFDRWFEKGINNAHLVSVSAYHD